jgi:hypothetical protein
MDRRGLIGWGVFVGAALACINEHDSGRIWKKQLAVCVRPLLIIGVDDRTKLVVVFCCTKD